MVEFGTVKVQGDALPPHDGAARADSAAGTRAPSLVGEDARGDEVRIEADGRAHLVVFLAHWCPHCNREAPRLASYLRSHAVPDTVEITLVLTGSDASSPNWPPSGWIARMGLGDVPAIVDSEDGAAGRAFGLDGYPFIVGLDRGMHVVSRRSGEQPDGFFAEAVDALART
jgi:hypothetical protein